MSSILSLQPSHLFSGFTKAPENRLLLEKAAKAPSQLCCLGLRSSMPGWRVLHGWGCSELGDKLGAHLGCTGKPRMVWCCKTLNICKKTPHSASSRISEQQRRKISHFGDTGAAKHPEMLSPEPGSLLQIQYLVFPEGEEGNNPLLPPARPHSSSW